MLNFACEAFANLDDLFGDPDGCVLDPDEDEAVGLAMLDMASDMLCLLSGMRVHGICTKTVRPIARGDIGCWPAPGMGASSGWSAEYGGLDVIPLRGPNPQVIEVMIDGVVLDPSEYGLIDGNMLYRTSRAFWPRYTDLTVSPYANHSFQFTFRFGHASDPLTVNATVELALELTLDAIGRATGNLPNGVGVTSLNVQGVGLTLRDRAEALRESDQQLAAVARFLGVYAPGGMKHQGIISPEIEPWTLHEVEGPSGS